MIIEFFVIISAIVDILKRNKLDSRYASYCLAGLSEMILFDSIVLCIIFAGV